MIKALRRLTVGLLARRMAQALDRVADQLATQNALLLRLADQFAPGAPVVDRQQIADESGVTFLDPVELILAQEFVLKSRKATGHDPTDEEVLTYLADEKTTDLHSRLIQRERDLLIQAEARR